MPPKVESSFDINNENHGSHNCGYILILLELSFVPVDLLSLSRPSMFAGDITLPLLHRIFYKRLP